MKDANEITVQVMCSEDELNKILKENNFKLKEEIDYNDIYMLNNLCDSKDELEILANCVLLRNIIGKECDIKQIVYKHKEYNELKEIVNQSQVKCNVDSLIDAKSLFEATGYRYLLEIRDHIKVYFNEKIEMAVQFVNDKHIYIEIEQDNNIKEFKNLEELKQIVKELNIPIKENDFFVKKAQIELQEINN